ncbi:hypothetical protein Tlet_1158 [Pseudothermotoga lettingae TMO]|uniref:Lipoprotein n=1 Tax=Pseudothermotoga lettingae (strain ATCC BAA-301 / DSM 14385 / NBRC 107922 / TMO) TaxID=416591 RepID=A8F6D9_PSELT|nr:hypothetical protein Tlet_1158 [Pseudothermotoga lettingae TMO]
MITFIKRGGGGDSVKIVFLTFLIAGLFILAGCGFISPTATDVNQIAKSLLNTVLDTLESEIPDPISSPTEFIQLIRKFVYTPDQDATDTDVSEAIMDLTYVPLFDFTWPSTLTSVELKGLSEIESKLLPYNWANPPDFVQKTYMMTVQGETEDGTITSFSLPFLIINDDGYFFAVFVDDTDSATEVRVYPLPLIF